MTKYLFIIIWLVYSVNLKAECTDSHLTSLVQSAQQIQDASLVCADGMLLAEVQKTQDSLGKVTLNMNYKSVEDMGLSQDDLRKALTYKANFYQYSSFQEALNYFKSISSQMSTGERQLLLSMFGKELSQSYDQNGDQEMNMNTIYTNISHVAAGRGVCGDLHKFLSQVASSLGMESAGTSSLMWQKNPNQGAAEGHAISYYKDPKSGIYYFQNYSQIYSTGKKDLKSAIDLATQVLGSVTDTSYVESRPGVTHTYTPAITQWVQSQISESARARNCKIHLGVQLSNDSRKVDVQVGNDNARAIAGVSEHSDSNHKLYSLSYVGVAGNAQSPVYQSKVVDEAQASLSVVAGAYGVSLPQQNYPLYSLSQPDGQKSSQNYFLNTQLKGRARIDQTTGRILLEAGSYDIGKIPTQAVGASQSAHASMTLDLEQQVASNAQVHFQRKAEVLPTYLGENAKNSNLGLKTTYDKIGVLFDNSSVDHNSYLKVGSDVYLLEGLGKASAVEVKESIAKVIPVEGGTFTLAADYSKVVQNKSQDPFYSSKSVRDLFVGFQQRLEDSGITYGGSMTRTLGNKTGATDSSSYFAPSVVTPGSTGYSTNVGVFVGVPLK